MYNFQDWATNLSTTPVKPLLRSLSFGRCQDRMSREPYSLLSDQGERPIPTLSFSDTEEFCLACMLTCVAECRVQGGRAGGKHVLQAFYHAAAVSPPRYRRFWSDMTSVNCLIPLPYADRTTKLSPLLFCFAPGKKNWEAETGEGRGQMKREKTGGEWNPLSSIQQRNKVNAVEQQIRVGKGSAQGMILTHCTLLHFV